MSETRPARYWSIDECRWVAYSSALAQPVSEEGATEAFPQPRPTSEDRQAAQS